MSDHNPYQHDHAHPDQASAVDDPTAAADQGPASQLVEDLRREIAELQQALTTRLSIGQLSGLLAAWLQMTTEDGWRVLRHTSIINLPLRDVARLLVASWPGQSVGWARAMRRTETSSSVISYITR